MDEWLIAEVNALSSETSDGFRQPPGGNEAMHRENVPECSGGGAPAEKRPKMEYSCDTFDYLGASDLFDGGGPSDSLDLPGANFKSELGPFVNGEQLAIPGGSGELRELHTPKTEVAEGQPAYESDSVKGGVMSSEPLACQVATDERDGKGCEVKGEPDDAVVKTENVDQKETEDDDDASKGRKKKKVAVAASAAAGATGPGPNMRKNIRDILTDDKLESETLAAQREEMERKRRLQEIQQRAHQELMAQQAFLRQQERHLMAAGMMRRDGPHIGPGRYGSQAGTMMPGVMGYRQPSAGDDVILVESSSGSSDEDSLNKSIIDISSSDSSDETTTSDSDDSDDDDDILACGDVSEEEDCKEGQDLNNSGSHVQDAFNQPDALGRVLVNVGHPVEDPDIFLAPQLSRVVKPHQIGGIRFLYDNIVESLSSCKTSNGFGCILAHSMGLGKTIQVVSFVDVFLRHTDARTVLIIVPINTIQNWLSEFNMWTPPASVGGPCSVRQDAESAARLGPGEVRGRHFLVHALTDVHKTPNVRAKAIRDWMNDGGVMLIGYEMYRIICSRKSNTVKLKRGRKGSVASMVADMEEEEKNKEFISDMQHNLLKPDLVICDEGHRIKNCHASTSQALKNIKTKRRVVLTGYPLQNNLIEYWCMVDFVRPNFLGTKSEFCNMFERPIQNGQCVDSTPEDVRLMRYRAHVLHSLLEGFIQRRGHSVLRLTLPQKYEHVLLVRMTPLQRRLYSTFMQELLNRNSITNPIKAFSVCCKIWNHPDVLYNCVKNLQSKGLEDDLDLEEAKLGPQNTSLSRRKGSSTTKMGSAGNMVGGPSFASEECLPPPGTEQEVGITPYKEKPESAAISYDWAHVFLKDYRPGIVENGLKMVLMRYILEQCCQLGDRLLLFSQSLFTLSLIEDLLSQLTIPYTDGIRWARNKNYFRLDGSTSSSEREKLINDFNSNPNILLFLISTRAGSLGINLVGANRVIVFDASWNPCHDTQAVCRVYRYGQTKPCHVYRFVTDNSLEKKIYDRQINKQGMSDRVVDELNPDVTLTMKEVSNLLVANEVDPPLCDLSSIAENYEDPIMHHICTNISHCLSRPPFEHESQLMDRKELKLTKKEKRLAKQSYEMDKKATGHFRYQRSDPFGMDFGHSGRPVANVRPMQFNNPRPTPLEALAKQGVTFKQINLSNEVRIPAPDGTGEPIVIPAGQQIMIISSPKGVYLRCPNNKLVLIKPPGQTDPSPLVGINGTCPIGNGSSTVSSGQARTTVMPSLPNRVGAANISKEAEVIDVSDEDDDVIVTSSAPQPPTFAGRNVIMSSGTNTYTSQNPGLLTGGLVLRNEPGRPGPQQYMRPIVTNGNLSSTRASYGEGNSSLSLDQLMPCVGDNTTTSRENPMYGNHGRPMYATSLAQAPLAPPTSMPAQIRPPTNPAAPPPPPNPNPPTATTTSNSDLPLSAMDYLNKTLSTPSYNHYPSWGSSSSSNWGTMSVQNSSPAADQVAFVSSIRDLLLPTGSRLFPTPTSRPELVTAPLSAKHLGDLYPHVLHAAANGPTLYSDTSSSHSRPTQ